MNAPKTDFVRACSLDELADKGALLVRGSHRPILMVHDRGRVFALDNRCPHMGFPLDRGSVEDGILTCHWHHARFDLASGCTFDLWADDVPTCPVDIRGAEVWVQPVFDFPDPADHWRHRLEDGMGHNLGLVIAKSVGGLLAAGVAPVEILRQAALFGARNRNGWGTGMTILTALGNLLPLVEGQDCHLALFHGVRRVAGDCAGEAPPRYPAAMTRAPDAMTLKRWLRHWNAVRHRTGAERTVQSAIAAGGTPVTLSSLLFAAETDRVFSDGGHSLDFINKAFECLELIGWEHAPVVLPTVISQMTAGRGAEESPQWRQPVDLVRLLETRLESLPAFSIPPEGSAWHDQADLARQLLGDDPAVIVDTLEAAIHAGATPQDLSRVLAYAAALRVAHFGTSNEHSDWETAHHVFTYCNALHQAIRRIGTEATGAAGAGEVPRAIFHGAMAVYLARYLNVPRAPIPGDDGDRLDELPEDAATLRDRLLAAFDHQRQVDTAARLVARYLLLGHPADPLIAILARALLREDAGFHAYQMLEAGVRQYREWGASKPGRHILIAVARYLAAHSPTERALFQTADIARRLLAGRALHEERPADAAETV